MGTKTINGRRVELTASEEAECQQRSKAWDECADERAAKSVRNRRDQLLRESDWTQLEDAPPTVKALYKPYRQALRDMPQQPGFPNAVDFPDKPGGVE